MPYTGLVLQVMWIILRLFNKFASSAQTNSTNSNQPNPVITAGVGDNVTLHCFRLKEDNTDSIIWYKQKIGQTPHAIVQVRSEPIYEDGFNPPKFSIEKEKQGFHLKIAKVEPSDEAVYYCGYIYFFTRFTNGTFLSVKDDEDIKVSVSQSRVSDSVPAGASVTLQCSVLSESRAAELQVLWFRAAPPQSHPQIIYTHHNSSHQCESGSSTHTRVYNFSKNILSLNDTGTYYCAVAVCGKIIFGNGTRVQLERSVDPAVIYLAVALGVCVFVIFAQTIIFKRRNCGQPSVRLKQGSVKNTTLNTNCDSVELNYAALHFTERSTKRGRVMKPHPEDTVYSDVRCSSKT